MSWRLGRLALWFDRSQLRSGWGFVGNVNSPYRWRFFLGPFALGLLRANWAAPIVLPRQARRALARGKAIDTRGYAHRTLHTLALVILTATVASAGEIVVRHKPGRTWNECRVEGTRTFTYFCDDAGVARPLSDEEAAGARLHELMARSRANDPIVEDPARVQQRQHDELLDAIDRIREPRPWSLWLGRRERHR